MFLKLIDRMLLNRLRVLDEFLSPFQNGFRSRRGTVEQAMALNLILSRAKCLGIPLVTLYVDFSKAFDSVTPQAVSAALAAFMVPKDVTHAILKCYVAHQVFVGESQYTSNLVFCRETLCLLFFLFSY